MKILNLLLKFVLIICRGLQTTQIIAKNEKFKLILHLLSQML